LIASGSCDKPRLTIRFSHTFLIPNQIPRLKLQQRLQQDVSMWCVLESS